MAGVKGRSGGARPGAGRPRQHPPAVTKLTAATELQQILLALDEARAAVKEAEATLQRASVQLELHIWSAAHGLTHSHSPQQRSEAKLGCGF